MKKEYVKPYIAVESFQLDAAIASSCSANQVTLGTLGYNISSCTLADDEGTFNDPGLGWFGPACYAAGGDDVTTWDSNPGGDANDEICYHGPVAGMRITDMFLVS